MNSRTEHDRPQRAAAKDPRRGRPSPRPRPVAPTAPPVPDDTVTNPEATEAQGAALRSWLDDAVRRYWTPPKLWTGPAASLQDLSDYAHHGEWASRTGALRALGIGWWRLVGLPITWLCRRLEWVAQRPGRFFAVLLLFELFIHSTPGQLVMHWLGVPLRWLAWLLL